MISRDVENGDKFHYVPSLPHGQETRTVAAAVGCGLGLKAHVSFEK